MGADKGLPESNAGIEGGTSGSLDGATMADLKRGYTTETEPDNDEDDNDWMNPEPFVSGFVGRSNGWER